MAVCNSALGLHQPIKSLSLQPVMSFLSRVFYVYVPTYVQNRNGNTFHGVYTAKQLLPVHGLCKRSLISHIPNCIAYTLKLHELNQMKAYDHGARLSNIA